MAMVDPGTGAQFLAVTTAVIAALGSILGGAAQGYMSSKGQKDAGGGGSTTGGAIQGALGGMGMGGGGGGGMGGMMGGMGGMMGGMGGMMGGGGGGAGGGASQSGWLNALMGILGGGMGGMCWVAEVLFGVNSQLTADARLWANTHDNWFTRLYRRHGQTWAAWLTAHPWAKPVVKPVWLAMAAAGKAQRTELLERIAYTNYGV